MIKKEKQEVSKYKRGLYAILALIMYFVPFFYYHNLKNTPFLGFNNTQTNLFIYVVVAFFSFFFLMGLLFTILALKNKENKKMEIKKGKLIFTLEILCLTFLLSTLVYLIIFYNVIIFLLIIPFSVFFVLAVWQLQKKYTNKKMITSTAILCLVAFSLTSMLSIFILEGNADYKKQNKFLDAFLMDSEVEYNEYGGWKNYPSNLGNFEATGFFHTTKQNGRYWFVDPSGKPFISKGVNHVDIDGGSAYRENALKKHGNEEKWAENAIEIVKRNGYNTVTSWSNVNTINKNIPYTILINFGDQIKYTTSMGSHSPIKESGVVDYYGDFFSEDFERLADSLAEQLVLPYKDSEMLLGYFTDNELVWGVDWRNNYTLTQIYMSYGSESVGKGVLIDLLETHSQNVENFNNIYKTSISSFDELWLLPWQELNIKSEEAERIEELFGGLMAERYSKVCHDAIRKYDSNHLILGCRFAFYPNEEIFVNAAKYTDVISYAGYFNAYYYTYGSKEKLQNLYEKIDKPMIINEYGVRAIDANMPNFLYSGPVVLTQKQRAVEASIFMERFLYQPYAIGYHWYKFGDNCIFGLLNGENYGIVDKNENEYTTFNEMMLKTNNSLELFHISSEREIKYKSRKLWG